MACVPKNCHVFHCLTWGLGIHLEIWYKLLTCGLPSSAGPVHQTDLSMPLVLQSGCLKATTQKAEYGLFNESETTFIVSHIKVEYSYKLFPCLYQHIFSTCLSLLTFSSQHQLDKCLVGPFCANESFAAELLSFCLLSTGLYSRYMEIHSFDAIIICFSGHLI